MKKRKYFILRMREDNPTVIERQENYHTGYVFESKQIKGKYFRVHPTTKDFGALCLMKHRYDKFAPATGNGVIIREDILKQFDA